MPTKRKSETARLNGAKSKGPKTEEGKRRSSLNALKHGFFSSADVLPFEDEEESNRLLETYIARFQPADEAELRCVREIVRCETRRDRLFLFEDCNLSLKVERMQHSWERIYERELEDRELFAEAWRSIADGSQVLVTIQRLDRLFARNMERALVRLEMLQKQRRTKSDGTNPPAHNSSDTNGLRVAADEPLQPPSLDRPPAEVTASNRPCGCGTVDTMDVRNAEERDIDRLARIWHDGWHESHAPIVPAELTRLRTLESFRSRLQAALPAIRVVGPSGAPVGFCIVKGDELYQLFVSAPARGSGVAIALIADAELQLSALGVETAWLACAIGNERAARFYEKCGWQRVGTMVNEAETSAGPFPLKVWRYEKSLTRAA